MLLVGSSPGGKKINSVTLACGSQNSITGKFYTLKKKKDIQNTRKWIIIVGPPRLCEIPFKAIVRHEARVFAIQRLFLSSFRLVIHTRFSDKVI